MDRPLRVVGYAVKREKAEKHVSAELIERASEAGIEIRVVDPEQPLEQQGPFDVLLQKIRLDGWEEQLARYRQRHPSMLVCDSPRATLPIRNRSTMLTMLEGEGWNFEVQKATSVWPGMCGRAPHGAGRPPERAA